MKKGCCLAENFFHFAHTILENQEEIGVSEDNVRRIRDLKINTKKDLIRSGAEIEILGVDIFSRLWDEKVDLTEVEKLIDKKFDLKREGLKKLIRTFVTVKNLLTRDQLKRLKIIRKADKASEESGSHSCR